ncbi:hypothetical protein N7466_010860 [Penicillium verhagenii]|uniref:uncharacterized protein n=1 Tax=Penicillium verhagenii TaxID=1562060 RepID=UPI002544EFA1|nr:uncharacterized protein N7466_010860 [Penicillium verhagenii]KAJ5917306.1 hypothetical protein N7466_010860 [Penicillium verhagenii]
MASAKQPELASAMKPAVAGICYDSPDWEQLPATPILSILQLKFVSEVNLEDISQTVSVLWRKSVEFVSTIPGFQELYWAPVDQSAATIMVLIQWDSGKAWSRFQCSLGFTMLLGYLENVTNRCMQLTLPDFLSTGFCLELFSYNFPVSQNAPEERQSDFKARWNSLFDVHSMHNMIFAYGGWIEDDYRSYKKGICIPALLVEGFKVENHYFGGFVFKKTNTLLQISHEIIDQLAVLASEATYMATCKTKQMRYEGRDLATKKPSPSLPSNQSTWRYPLLGTPVNRQCDLEDSDRLDPEDRVHIQSIEESFVRGNKRLVHSPAGTWTQMGSLNQYEVDNHVPIRTRESKAVLEVISFRLLHPSSSFDNLFAGFRVAVWKLRDNPGLWRASDNDDPSQIFLLANLGDIKSASWGDKERFHRLIHDFEFACRGTIEDLSYMQIPGPDISGSGTGIGPHILEFTIFHIANYDLRAFEYAYQNLIKTTRVQRLYGGTFNYVQFNAVSDVGRDYDADLQTTKFTTVWRWQSGSGGQKQWYDEFASRSQSEYERLGHIIDWLRTVFKSAHNVLLNIEPSDSALPDVGQG